MIPSNHKWFRNLAISKIVAETLESLKMQFPEPTVDIEEIKKKYHAIEEAEGRPQEDVVVQVAGSKPKKEKKRKRKKAKRGKEKKAA